MTLVRRSYEMTKLEPGYIAVSHYDCMYIYKTEKKPAEQYHQEMKQYHAEMKVYREKLPVYNERWRALNRFVNTFGDYSEEESIYG